LLFFAAILTAPQYPEAADTGHVLVAIADKLFWAVVA
jgi:hypothetical protein